MELYHGRPASVDGRIAAEVETYDFLDRLGIEYLRTDHEAAENMEACDRIDAVLGIEICKNLCLCNRQETRFYLLMMPGHKPFKTRELSAQIQSSRLSFASPQWMQALLGLTPGSVSLMGLIHDRENRVTLLMDEDVVREPYIGCHPCINTSSLKIATRDILETFLPATGHRPTMVRLTGI